MCKGASDSSFTSERIHSHGSRYSKVKKWTFPSKVPETVALMNCLVLNSIHDSGYNVEVRTWTVCFRAFSRTFSMSLKFLIDSLLPTAHLELIPASCLLMSAFDNRPCMAVSVYSKSSSVWKGAQGQGSDRGWKMGPEELIERAGDKVNGMIMGVGSWEWGWGVILMNSSGRLGPSTSVFTLSTNEHQ